MLDDLPLVRREGYTMDGWWNDDVVWCIKSMTDPSVCVIAQPERPASPPPCSDHVCVMHAPDHVHTKRSQGSSAPPPLCDDHVPQRCCDNPSETPLLRPRLRLRTPEAESDTLETRTKLTSHSALECGGLPQLPVPIHTSREPETPAGLNSRLEAVSGA